MNTNLTMEEKFALHDEKTRKIQHLLIHPGDPMPKKRRSYAEKYLEKTKDLLKSDMKAWFEKVDADAETTVFNGTVWEDWLNHVEYDTDETPSGGEYDCFFFIMKGKSVIRWNVYASTATAGSFKQMNNDELFNAVVNCYQRDGVGYEMLIKIAKTR